MLKSFRKTIWVRRRHVQLQSGLRAGHDGGSPGSVAFTSVPSRWRRRSCAAFFNAAKGTIDVPWDIAVGNDLRHPQVQGPRSPKARFINWYLGKLHMAARCDAVLANAFLKVANLTMSPTGLLHPSVVMRVIYGNIKWRARPSEAGSLESAG
jgi:hypothetical protein